MKFSLLLVSALAAADAFTAPMPMSTKASVGNCVTSRNVELMMAEEVEGEDKSTNNLAAVPAITAAIWALTSTSAMAAGPDWGVFEGRIGSLLHPITMISMLALSVSTGLLGFEWRRQRTIGEEMSTLKKSLPNLGGASSVAGALAAAQAADPKDVALISKLQAAVPVEAQIKDMQVERKELSEKGPKDQHYSQGTTLAFIGTCFAIEVSLRFDLIRGSGKGRRPTFVNILFV
jgi:hypothetical protein